MGAILSSAYAGLPLPRGEYPTAKWPEGLSGKHVYTLRPHVQPLASKVVEVTLEGATHTVALEGDGEGDYWIDSIKLGGKWHSACDTFTQEFLRALESQIRADFAAEAGS